MIRSAAVKLISPLFAALFLATLASGFAQEPVERRITLVFRYDDYSSLSVTDFESKLISAMHQYQIPCTFSVIPFIAESVHDPAPQRLIPLSSAKAAILKRSMQAGLLEIALHGYSHQTLPSKVRQQYSEFKGRDYQGQLKRITEGKAFLEKTLGIRIDTFVPPWDSYDSNTLRALEAAGFTNFSAEPEGVVNENSKLNFLPVTCDLEQLKSAIEAARQSDDEQPVIVVLFHQYDFMEVDKKREQLGYREFLNLLDWINRQPDIRVLTLRDAIEVIGDFTPARMATYQHLAIPFRFAPSSLHAHHLYYPSSATLHRFKVKSWTLLTLFYLGLFVVMLVGTLLFKRRPLPKHPILGLCARYSGLLVLAFFLFYRFEDQHFGFERAIILTCLAGIVTGLWGSSLRRKHVADVGGEKLAEGS